VGDFRAGPANDIKCQLWLPESGILPRFKRIRICRADCVLGHFYDNKRLGEQEADEEKLTQIGASLAVFKGVLRHLLLNLLPARA
jgi:hypothetical protein